MKRDATLQALLQATLDGMHALQVTIEGCTREMQCLRDALQSSRPPGPPLPGPPRSPMLVERDPYPSITPPPLGPPAPPRHPIGMATGKEEKISIGSLIHKNNGDGRG